MKEYGADSSRVFTLFAAPPEKELEWNMNGLAGAYRFINRLYLLISSTADFADKMHQRKIITELIWMQEVKRQGNSEKNYIRQ